MIQYIYKGIANIFYRISSFFLLLISPNLKISLKEFWLFIEYHLEGNREIKFEAVNRHMIESIFGMHDTIVREIMVPRTELAAARVSDSVDKVVSLIREKGRSRIPIFEDKIDNIVGVAYAKDILRKSSEAGGKEVSVEKIMREPYFVPETKNIIDLLTEFRLKQVHLAIVIDEYGGTAGLVTMEDLIEEIIGEVQDEYDKEVDKIHEIDDESWRVDAKISLEDLNDRLKIEIPREEDYDTLSGFILYKLGRIPKHKEKVSMGEYDFIVVEANEKSIEKVKIIKRNEEVVENENNLNEEGNRE